MSVYTGVQRVFWCYWDNHGDIGTAESFILDGQSFFLLVCIAILIFLFILYSHMDPSPKVPGTFWAK